MGFASLPVVTKISWQTDAIAAALVGVIALAVRIAVVWTAPEYPLVADLQEYWERAIYMFEQSGAMSESAWRMPGYPAALALAFSLGSGPSLLAVRLFNAVAGMVTALLTYWLARRTAGFRASIAAALAMALYPTFVLYSTLVVTEAVVTAPVLGALIAVSYRSRGSGVAGGLCAGLATLVRPAGIATLPAVLVSLVWQPDGRRRKCWKLVQPTMAVVAFFLAMAPWWLHNARVHGRFVPFDTTGAYAFLVGNISYATGLWEWEVVGRMEGELSRAAVDWTTPEGAVTANAWAIRDIRANPIAAVMRIPSKIAGLLSMEGREHAFAYSYGYFGQRGSTTVRLWGIAIMASFPPLLVAALFALALRGTFDSLVYVSSAAYVATTIAMHVITLGDPRYHLPVVPALAVLATGLGRWNAGFDRRRLAVVLVIVAALIGLWSWQAIRYWTLLSEVAAPNGWAKPLPFMDLL